MKQIDTHVCLVSQQAMPNLLPLLDANLRPRKVVLACSSKMKDQAEALKTVIRDKVQGIGIEILDLGDAYDYATLIEKFFHCLIRHPDDSIGLNVTGGTKLMAVAAQEVFRSEKKPVFYVNVENDEVIVLDEPATATHHSLRAKLKVSDLLRAHGYSVNEVQHPQIPREQRDLASRLVDYVKTHGAALGVFNWLAQEARPNLHVKMSPEQADSRNLGDILAQFEQAKLLTQTDLSLRFANEAARAFANGGWLEYFVLEQLESLRGERTEHMTDVVLGLRVGFGQGKGDAKKDDKNEIDLAFLFRNTLHLIECKTANLARPGITASEDKAAEAIYKMESLLKLGGLRTKGMIVDYRGSLSASDVNKKRAAEAKIEIASGPQLRDLKGLIARKWLSV